MSAPAVLLDTNAAIAWTRLDPPFFAALPKGGLPCLSLFTLGELAFGAEFSARRDENLHSLSALERDSRLILPNRETAMHFGSLHAALRRKGRPIPVNDIWGSLQQPSNTASPS